VQSKFIKTKLSDDVANYLRKAIIEGVYPPEYHLNEPELARELNISRGPIREAISQLEADGLVYRPGNGRTKVLKFDESDFEDYLNLRTFLESQACRIIIKNAPDDVTFASWLAAAKHDLEQLAISIESGIEIMSNQYDYSFHDNLMEKAGSVVLLRAWKSISGFRRSIMETNIKYAGSVKNNYFRDHMGILEGIESGDVSLMEQGLQKHYKSGRMNFHKMQEVTRNS